VTSAFTQCPGARPDCKPREKAPEAPDTAGAKDWVGRNKESARVQVSGCDAMSAVTAHREANEIRVRQICQSHMIVPVARFASAWSELLPKYYGEPILINITNGKMESTLTLLCFGSGGAARINAQYVVP
jgi:hypothetical protein